MKAKKRFYWLGALEFNSGAKFPLYWDHTHIPDWAVHQMQIGYRDVQLAKANKK